MASPTDSSSPSGLDRSDAAPPTETDLTASLVELVRRGYRGWSGLGDPRFIEDEIGYKREAAAKIRELLAEEMLRDLVARERFPEVIDRVKKAAQATNLLFRGVPSSGDLAVLHAEALDTPSFSAALIDLLHGDGASPERLERFSSYLEERSLPNKWALPTYLLFFLFPEREMFVKPHATRWLLRQAGIDTSYTSRPSAEVYAQILALANELLAGLEPLGARDMIDVQSVVFVAYWVSSEIDQLAPSDAKRREMEGLFEDFFRDYVVTAQGREHLAAYEPARESARENFQEIVAAQEAGEDVTERVLRKLLPHADNAANREAGAWIHIAPAINGDIRTWYEARGSHRPDDWQGVAEAILDFAQRVIEDPGELADACRDFDALTVSTGFQAGLLTPLLNALSPDHFLLVNNKSRRLINYLAGTKLSQKLLDYPELNRVGQILIEQLADILESPPATEPAGARTGDVFDAFAHWLVSIRNFAFGGARYWKIAPGENARFWDDWFDRGFASIGWNDLGDLSGISHDEFEKRRDRLIALDPNLTANALNQVWKLAHEIEEGDKIVANEGTRKVLGFGTVTGPYEFVAEDHGHRHRRPVDWEDVRPRSVDEKGWTRTVVPLDRDKFDRLRIAPIIDGVDSPTVLTLNAFNLLGELFREPTRDRYAERKEDFKRWLEVPFRDLMGRVIERLPDEIVRRMETEKNLYGRILKNDYGRGGAWPFYWGAIYPKGSRRTEGAQLILSIKPDRLEAGFDMGETDDEVAKRFVANVARHKDRLARMLRHVLTRTDLVFGDRDQYEDEQGHFRFGEAPSGDEWLRAPNDYGIDIVKVFPRQDVVGRSNEELAEEIAHLFSQLFPFVLLGHEDDPVQEVRHYLAGPRPEHEPEINPPYPLPDLAADLKMDALTIERWVRAIERKKQAILYGPPGTGKTYAAEHLARHLIGEGDGFRDLVQFHPSYAYEDFIQGIRPEALADGGLHYPIRRGRFLEFCDEARTRDGTCVLIVDEINRANLSRVFGELMYLLENRDKAIPLAAGGETFSIPENVRILGTMNTADRSIALVDHALRRRFAFLELKPDYDTLTRYHESGSFAPEPLIELLREVNDAIGDPHYAVGITYFLRESLAEHLEDIWSMEIVPYLEEYFADRQSEVERFRWPRVERHLAQ